MPRRRHEDQEERWERKRRRYENKLNEAQWRRRSRIIYSEESDEQIEDHPQNGNDLDVEFSESAMPSLQLSQQASEPQLEPDAVAPTSPAAQAAQAACVDSDVDTEILKALGDPDPEEAEWGEDLHKDIAKRIQQILPNGLKKEIKDELLKKYLFPKNTPLAKAPTLNPEVGAMLAESGRNRDKRIYSKQDQLGRALSALGKAMTTLVKKKPDIPEAMSLLNDVLKLVSDAHYMETDTRRSLILGLVDKSLMDSFKNRKRDEYLFGDKLGDLVKNTRGIKKTGQLIQAPSTSNLNWKGPPVRSRVQRGPPRTGGYQTQYPNRRRVVQPPGPPPARRHQPAPPAPRRQAAADAPSYTPRRPPPPPPPPQHRQSQSQH